MKILELRGSPRRIGHESGEALREDIRRHIEMFPVYQKPDEAWDKRLPVFVDTLKCHLPAVLEEMQATAEGANLPLKTILRLNMPMPADELSIGEGCTNIVFANGRDGPIWGKNNDRPVAEPARPVCSRLIRRDDAIPVAVVSFCGVVGMMDAINAEGLVIGHSSVGSRFQQSDRHVPIRLWGYEHILHSRTTNEFVQRMISLPTRGKGYSAVCVDRHSNVCSLEAPCPLMQIRRSKNPYGHIHCVNCYQLPTLLEADRRTPADKANARARWQLLDQKLSEDRDFSIDDMKSILRSRDDVPICRDGQGEDDSVTEYSLIGLARDRELLYLEGLPTEAEYQRVCIC